MANLWNSTKRWTTGFLTSKPNRTAPDAAATSTGLVGAYLSMLEVKPVSGTSLVQIKFTTPDPALSARLANAHAFAYVRYGIDLRSQTNEEASEFLQQKLTELKERVEQSEAALNSYRRDKGIISVDDKQNVVVDRLLDLNKTLTAAEADRIALEAQVRTIRGRNSTSFRRYSAVASLAALRVSSASSKRNTLHCQRNSSRDIRRWTT